MRRIALISLENDKGIDTLSLDIMRIAYHGAFNHARMHIDSIFHFGRPDAMTADIQYIIHPSGDAVIALGIPERPVPRKVKTGIGGKIGLPASFMIAIGGAQNGRPGEFYTEIAGNSLAGQAHGSISSLYRRSLLIH